MPNPQSSILNSQSIIPMNADETPKYQSQSEAIETSETSETDVGCGAIVPALDSDEVVKESITPISESSNWDDSENTIAPLETPENLEETIQPSTQIEDSEKESTIALSEKSEIETENEPIVKVSEAFNPMQELVVDIAENVTEKLTQRVEQLQKQQEELKQEIESLRTTKIRVQQELIDTQNAMGRLIQEGLAQLEQRKQTLQIEVDKLERRRDRIQKEMRTTFAGVSQDLAIRVQGFKDYLVGSLQELVGTAEQLELTPQIVETPPKQIVEESKTPPTTANPKFAEQGFQEQAKQIRRILDQYRTLPDYYGPPWQLRRTFEPIHAERISNWFFSQGGRGALRSMGSRLQNILIASTAISVLRSISGSRVRTLVLANSPERLGEWRRGLQDCLGITRNDFGPERGITLFEAPEPLIQKAERLVKEGKLPLIIIDEMEEQINLSLLQFPLWLAFSPDPQTLMSRDREYRDF